MDNGNLNNGEVMSQLKQQIAMAHVQQMLSKMTSKCFNKCITKPGRALDGTEQRCITQCMDRFMDTWDHVSRTYGNRIQREQAKGFQNVSTLN